MLKPIFVFCLNKISKKLKIKEKKSKDITSKKKLKLKDN
jgi:hypothetical protein